MRSLKIHRSTRAKQGQRPSSAANLRRKGVLYLEIARTLRTEIVAGTYPTGSHLPTEEQLCARFDVSRHTVREALRRLRDDNLVYSRKGSGTVVAPGPSSHAYAHDVMSINDLVSWSVGKRFAIESMEMITLTEKLAERTGLKRGQNWLAIRGYGHLEGVSAPVCGAEYYINNEFAAVGRLLQRHTGPIFPVIEDLFGQKIVEVFQDISAVLLSQELADVLKVKPASPALHVRREYKTAEAKIAQVTISIHPASRYRHSMTMRRVNG